MDISNNSYWFEADASNSQPPPDGFPEGMNPSAVDDAARMMMGALKRWYNWTIPKTTGGTSTAYTLTYTVAPAALVDGMTHLVEFNAANANAPTLNVNGLGAIPIHYYSAGAWRVVPAALWAANETHRVAYNSSASAYRIIDRPDTTGDLIPTGRSTARAGTILGYGQAISRTAYAGLFAAYGTTFGVGDGSTTFNLPDLQGRVVAGKDDMSGSAAGRITSSGSGITGTSLGAAGGSERQSTMDGPNLTQLVEGAAVTNPVLVAHQGHSHANVRVMQPTIIGNYAICL